MTTPVDMDGKPYALGQIVLTCPTQGGGKSKLRLEKREVFDFQNGNPVVRSIGSTERRGGQLRCPERHYIIPA